MDHKFTDLIQKWLATPKEERNNTVGNLYLLKLSGNQIMYRNIAVNPDKFGDHIEYQLQKYYNFRVKELTHDEVVAMQQQVDVIVVEHKLDESQESKDENKPDSGQFSLDNNRVGKRDDHDYLPDNIKALYVENLSLLRRMRELHLKLRSLSLEDSTCPDSERYPFLKQIIALDKKLHANWERYDHYIPTAPAATAAATPQKAASRKKSASKK